MGQAGATVYWSSRVSFTYIEEGEAKGEKLETWHAFVDLNGRQPSSQNDAVKQEENKRPAAKKETVSSSSSSRQKAAEAGVDTPMTSQSLCDSSPIYICIKVSHRLYCRSSSNSMYGK
ncbi:hypothetical protein OUZ56_001627 [Daphnia magna]|uniref:Uncharacterized protein n=1 Tax=Daphnia magna TaxID=35525 RepID=A0ABR0A3S3_9CRUS|nr:hypothetical protein OUZ56_001627 [Daphnia magna]